MDRFIDGFNIDVDPGNGTTYTVTITTTEEAVVRAVEVLNMVLGVSDRIKKSMKNTSSMMRAQTVLLLRQAQHREIAQAYHTQRRNGVKHRAAIANVLQLDVAKGMHYTKTEVYHCIKAYPEERLTITSTTKGDDHDTESERAIASSITGA